MLKSFTVNSELIACIYYCYFAITDQNAKIIIAITWKAEYKLICLLSEWELLQYSPKSHNLQ